MAEIDLSIGRDPRRLAWAVLIAVDGGAFADAELGRYLAALELTPRDRALATRLVYGTLAWQGYLDCLIDAWARRAQRLDVPVRTLLRLALFQLAKLSRIPDFAAVNTAVELSKAYRKGAAAGLINALLRRYLRDRDCLPFPSREAHEVEFLAVARSHPRWLVERWIAELGAAETEKLLAADNEAAPTVLRVNRRRATRERVLRGLADAGVVARAGRYGPDAIVLETGCDATALPGYAEGRFTVQGEASQLVALLVGAGPGHRILDACAAPGGKTTYLAEIGGDTAAIVAVDRKRAGLAHLRATAQRLGLRNVEILAGDVCGVLSGLGGPRFDAVLLDVPCSGLGTLREHPEIRWRQTVVNVAKLAATQRALLTAVSSVVRGGGVIVYSTCALTEIENEGVVAVFLTEHPEFEVVDPRPYLPAAAHGMVDARGFLRTYPHRHDMDGFFAARLRCRG